eukprot:2977498-Rhodomonas_salina.1
MSSSGTVPVHLLNVHAALCTEEEFDHVLKAGAETAEALAAARAMQSDFLCTAFADAQTLGAPPDTVTANLYSEDVPCLMHTVITGTAWKGDCERTDAVL